MPWGRGPGWVPGPGRAAGGWGRRGVRQWEPRTGTVRSDFGRLTRIQWTAPALTGTIKTDGTLTLTLPVPGGILIYPHEVTLTSTIAQAWYASIWRGGPNGVPVTLLGSTSAVPPDTVATGDRVLRAGDALVVMFAQAPPNALVTVQFEGAADVLA